MRNIIAYKIYNFEITLRIILQSIVLGQAGGRGETAPGRVAFRLGGRPAPEPSFSTRKMEELTARDQIVTPSFAIATPALVNIQSILI